MKLNFCSLIKHFGILVNVIFNKSTLFVKLKYRAYWEKKYELIRMLFFTGEVSSNNSTSKLFPWIS